MQPYYRLMKSILFVLLLSFGMISCEKEDPVATSPTTRQTDDSTTDPTDPDPTDPVVRSNNEQTVFMYLPWSNNLTSFFLSEHCRFEKYHRKQYIEERTGDRIYMYIGHQSHSLRTCL